MAAVAAVALAAAVVLVGGGRDYTVRANFVTASQLVEGNRVTVAGEEVGSVEEIELTDDGQAQVRFTVDDAYAPLRHGTTATVRIQSLSGVANRYIELQLGPAEGASIPDGGLLATEQTSAAIEVDQLFNIFDRPTREDVQKTLRLLAEFTAGNEEEARAALRYLSPALAASSRLFDELAANDTMLERFIVESSRLVTDLGARDDALAALIADLATTTDALASRQDRLRRAVELLPPFMRRANTTFVNLRGTLDDLAPVVEASMPLVRRQLPDLLGELRPLAREAVPTLRALSRAIRRPGDGNDLVEFLRAVPPVEHIATDAAPRNGKMRPGALPAAERALAGVTPQLSFLRPYTVDLVGWFDDFSHSGVYDALGSFSRAGLQFNAFTFTPLLGTLAPVPPQLRDDVLATNLELFRNNRCPGSANPPAEDGSNPYVPHPGFDCDPSEVAGTLP